MQPNNELITINNNINLIKDFLHDMFIYPRNTAHKWSKITNQTPNLKIGYPGQHLASLITGIKGTATGARGNDIADGSEVKSCSKVDQSDKCLDCGTTVLRSDDKCPNCASSKIKRNNDSKWLICIRNEDELRMLLEETPRFIFIVTDYPNFAQNNYRDIRIRCFEIWVKSERCIKFKELLNNYYFNIYLKHIDIDPKKTPAPKNLFPDNFQFFMCNPIKTFQCTIHEALSDGVDLEIDHYVEPDKDRSNLASEDMPVGLLNRTELSLLRTRGIDINSLKFITEEQREFLPLRDTDRKIKQICTKKHKV